MREVGLSNALYNSKTHKRLNLLMWIMLNHIYYIHYKSQPELLFLFSVYTFQILPSVLSIFHTFAICLVSGVVGFKGDCAESAETEAEVAASWLPPADGE